MRGQTAYGSFYYFMDKKLSKLSDLKSNIKKLSIRSFFLAVKSKLKEMFTIQFPQKLVFADNQNYINQIKRDNLRQKKQPIFQMLFSEWKERLNPNTSISSTRFTKIGENKKKIIYVIITIVGIIAILFFVRGLASSISKDSKNDQIDIKSAEKLTDLNKEFAFPLKNSEGEEVSSFKYEIVSAELRDEIIVQGQKATAVKGRKFMIVNLKLSNSFDKSIEVNTRDYIRLSVNENQDEWLAPDIHNDPVEIQAISTKNTRVGFPINESDTKLVLQIGEINGEKQKVDINF